MNVVISDMKSIPGEFLSSLQDTTKVEWKAINWQSNQMRTSKLTEVRRYLMYIFKPLCLVFRNDFDAICSWQQFYGISYAFWSRLFDRPKRTRQIVMTFIYKPKSGIVGRLYEKYVRYAVTSQYIDILTCSSSDECDRYSQLFDVPREKFVFVPWSIEDRAKDFSFDVMSGSGYVLSPGRSNRDYPFLINALTGTDYRVKIVDDTLGDIDVPCNIDVIRNSTGDGTLRLLQDCWAVVLPIDDPDVSAGQTVLLQAWSFGKPVVCTRGRGLSDDYISDNINGLLIDKDQDQLVNALDRLRNDAALYMRLMENGRLSFLDNYTEEALGRHVGEAFLKLQVRGDNG